MCEFENILIRGKGEPVREDDALQVEDVSALLGVGRNTVYSLAKSGALASYRVGRKLRFTRYDVQRYIDSSKTGGPASAPKDANDGPVAHRSLSAAAPIPEIEAPKDPFVIAGDDIAADIALRCLSTRGLACSRAYLGSYLSLIDLYLGRADAAVVNLYDRKSNAYNTPYIQRIVPGTPVSVVRIARREVGIFVQSGNPKRVHSWGSLLTRDVSLINTPRGSATRVLLDEMLCELEARPESIRGYDREVSSDLVAPIIAKGAAEAGVGNAHLAAATPGVDFIPMHNEWIDIVVKKTERTRPLVRAVKRLGDDPRVRRELEALGFDAARLGSIVYES